MLFYGLPYHQICAKPPCLLIREIYDLDLRFVSMDQSHVSCFIHTMVNDYMSSVICPPRLCDMYGRCWLLQDV